MATSSRRRSIDDPNRRAAPSSATRPPTPGAVTQALNGPINAPSSVTIDPRVAVIESHTSRPSSPRASRVRSGSRLIATSSISRPAPSARRYRPGAAPHRLRWSIARRAPELATCSAASVTDRCPKTHRSAIDHPISVALLAQLRRIRSQRDNRRSLSASRPTRNRCGRRWRFERRTAPRAAGQVALRRSPRLKRPRLHHADRFRSPTNYPRGLPGSRVARPKPAHGGRLDLHQRQEAASRRGRCLGSIDRVLDPADRPPSPTGLHKVTGQRDQCRGPCRRLTERRPGRALGQVAFPRVGREGGEQLERRPSS